MKKFKPTINLLKNWGGLLLKTIFGALILCFGFYHIYQAYTDPSPITSSAEKHVGDVEGYWFELPIATSNTVNISGNARILHIDKLKNGEYKIKFSLGEKDVFDEEFENKQGILQANSFVPFGGGRKFMILRSNQVLIFEGMPYLRMGKEGHITDLMGIKILQVKLLDIYNGRGRAKSTDSTKIKSKK